MPTINALRALVVAEVLFLAASVLTVFIPDATTPAVDEYLDGPGAGPLMRLVDGDSTALALIVGVLLAAFVAIYVTSLIGLLLLKPWSRRLYLVSFIVGASLYLFMGSSLVDPIRGTLDFLASACSGAILATLYLSDARTIFGVQTPNKSLERMREG